ncbi:MAG: PDGLE domain-containing protein, partial [Dolichospermum sp.]
PLAEYNIQGLGKIGTSIAGLVGATACFAVAFGIAKIIRPKNA